MKKIVPPKKIYVANSKTEGLGVFASQNIKKGEIIEIAPVLLMKFEELIDTKWNLLFDYYYWLDDYVALMLGYASLYNHSDDNNADHNLDVEKKVVTFIANRDIKKDEEISFNYRGTSTTKTPLWFER